MDPTLPSMPMNIVPPQMQTAMQQAPLGVLNGQQPPQQGNPGSLLQQAQQLMKGPGQPPQMPQIQMARPLGTQGIDPMKLLQAMKQNNLMNG